MIDYGFITLMEGSKRNGYVPDPEHSNSGVTIASGFDLGQRSASEITKAFTPELADKLLPYVGMKKQAAVDFLMCNALSISESEEKEINSYSHLSAECRLLSQWRRSEVHCDFGQLASPCQTVIASVAFQYGNLQERTPEFWQQVTSANWGKAVTNLRNFGDRYSRRRNLEADLLENWLYS